MRIVSLLASATEWVCRLGLESQLVGISHECDTPSSIEKLPRLSQPNLDWNVSSASIDGQVKSLLQKSLSIFKVDFQLLEELRPTHILTQNQCHVCAVSEGELNDFMRKSISSLPKLLSLAPHSLDHIFQDVIRMGEFFGVEERAARLQKQIQNELMDAKAEPGQRPQVFCMEWTQPLMASGNWMPELIELAGGTSLFGQAGQHSKPMAWQDVVEKNPDILIVSPCGYSLNRACQELELLQTFPNWETLEVVKNKRVYFVDGNLYFHRSAPRLLEYVEILKEIFFQKSKIFEGEAWMSRDSARRCLANLKC